MWRKRRASIKANLALSEGSSPENSSSLGSLAEPLLYSSTTRLQPQHKPGLRETRIPHVPNEDDTGVNNGIQEIRKPALLESPQRAAPDTAASTNHIWPLEVHKSPISSVSGSGNSGEEREGHHPLITSASGGDLRPLEIHKPAMSGRSPTSTSGSSQLPDPPHEQHKPLYHDRNDGHEEELRYGIVVEPRRNGEVDESSRHTDMGRRSGEQSLHVWEDLVVDPHAGSAEDIFTFEEQRKPPFPHTSRMGRQLNGGRDEIATIRASDEGPNNNANAEMPNEIEASRHQIVGDQTHGDRELIPRLQEYRKPRLRVRPNVGDVQRAVLELGSPRGDAQPPESTPPAIELRNLAMSAPVQIDINVPHEGGPETSPSHASS
ncbi:hypothetical protein H0H93_012867, partial [Arthromyces matolae]